MTNELASQSLAQDPRIAEAKKLIQAAIKDHQHLIEKIQPALPDLKKSYADLLQTFAGYRGNKLYFPYIGSGFGNGALVELLDGSIKYDFISGIGPHYMGHNHPLLLDAAIDAALSDTTMQGHLQQNGDSIEFSKLLLEYSKFDHCFLTSSGTMANENALKIAFQARFPASRILAFSKCFVGRTLAIAQITDKAAFREGLPLNYQIDYIPFFDYKRPQESIQEAIATLKTYLTRYPKQYAVMIFELVQGEGGFNTAPREFFTAIMDILKENQIVIFDDEVQSFGRTPSLFAFQHFQLEKYIDIISIGKLSQTCATLFKKELAPRAGLLSQTFTSSTAAIKAGIVILHELMEKGYYGPNGKIQQLHDYTVNLLEGIANRHPDLLEGPYGIGSMIAFTPLKGDNKKVPLLVQKLFEEGVMCFVAGSNPTRIRFLMPVGAVTHVDIENVCQILENTLVKFNAEVPK